jgi:hypothetical protein
MQDRRGKQVLVSVIKNATEPFLSQTSLVYDFIRVDYNYIIVYVLLSNYFDISTLDYVSVSTQML